MLKKSTTAELMTYNGGRMEMKMTMRDQFYFISTPCSLCAAYIQSPEIFHRRRPSRWCLVTIGQRWGEHWPPARGHWGKEETGLSGGVIFLEGREKMPKGNLHWAHHQPAMTTNPGLIFSSPYFLMSTSDNAIRPEWQTPSQEYHWMLSVYGFIPDAFIQHDIQKH